MYLGGDPRKHVLESGIRGREGKVATEGCVVKLQPTGELWGLEFSILSSWGKAAGAHTHQPQLVIG